MIALAALAAGYGVSKFFGDDGSDDSSFAESDSDGTAKKTAKVVAKEATKSATESATKSATKAAIEVSADTADQVASIGSNVAIGLAVTQAVSNLVNRGTGSIVARSVGSLAGKTLGRVVPGLNLLSAGFDAYDGVNSADEWGASKGSSAVGNVLALGNKGGWGGALQGALQGALLGAGTGAFFAGIGAIPGAIGGGILGAITGAFGGEKIAHGVDSVLGTGPANAKGKAPVSAHSHRHGLFSVPDDDYLALLHKDETVLPKRQAGKLKAKTGATNLSNLSTALEYMPAMGGDTSDERIDVLNPKSFIYDVVADTGNQRADYRKFIDKVSSDPEILKATRLKYAWGSAASSDSTKAAEGSYSLDPAKAAEGSYSLAPLKSFHADMSKEAVNSQFNGNPQSGHPLESWRITSPYGPRKSFKTVSGKNASSLHKGIDFTHPDMKSKPVVAMEDGYVTFSSRPGPDGVVELQADSGRYFRMMHMARQNTYGFGLTAKHVKRGDPLALVEMNPNKQSWVTGPHLHFEYKPANSYKLDNPIHYLGSYWTSIPLDKKDKSAKEAPRSSIPYLKQDTLPANLSEKDKDLVERMLKANKSLFVHQPVIDLRQKYERHLRTPEGKGGPDPSFYSAPIVSQLSKMTARLESKLEEVYGVSHSLSPTPKPSTSVLQYA